MLTVDRSPSVLTDEQIGRTRYLTPEGFLFCEGVRIARVGPMLYLQSEVPEIEPSGPGMITITRDPEVLFDPEAMSSFNGKPITNEHPPTYVLPENWKAYSVGTVMNPRRGEGVEADYLLTDFLITDQAAIDAVMAGKVEVSPGYEAPREQIKPGLGRQTKIVGNHVALVERGRGGPACAIQDAAPEQTQKEITMPKRSAWDRLRTAFKAQDEAAFEEEMKEAQGSKDEESDTPQKLVIEVKGPDAAEAKEEPKATEDEDDPMAEVKAMLTTICARLDKLEAPATADEGAEEKKDEEEKKEEMTSDSAALRDAFADVRAKAEILCPGISLPTFDARARIASTKDAMHDLRVRALKGACADGARKAIVVDAFGGKEPKFEGMTADSAEMLFNASVALAKAANRPTALQHRAFPQGPMTPAKYQELMNKSRARG